jgi:hypothetical protein
MIFGVKGDGKTEVQAYRFPVSRFTAEEARAFCQKHKGRFEAATGKKEGKEYSSFRDVPNPAPPMFLYGEQVFHESGNFDERTRINRDSGIVENMVFLGAISENKRDYKKAMAKAVGRYDGAKMFFNHGEPGKRDVARDLWGRGRNPRYIPEEDKIRGDAKIINHHETVYALVEGASDAIGLSHVARCDYKTRKDGWVEIEEIEKVFSVDLVDETGTTKGMFENLEEERRQEEEEMEIETVKDLREKFPTLVEEIVTEATERVKKESEDENVTKEMEKILAENEALKAKVAEGEKVEAIADSERRLKERLEKSRLPEGVRTMVLLEAKGRAFTDEVIEKEVQKTETLCEEAVKNVASKGTAIPETKTEDDGKKTVTEYVKGFMFRHFGGEQEEKKEKE